MKKLGREMATAQNELSRREARILELRTALHDALVMIDASSFGGHKHYRCLTPTELQHLEELRELVK